MQNRYPLYAVLVLCLAAGRLLADPLLVPTKDNGKQPLKVTLTDDNRGLPPVKVGGISFFMYVSVIPRHLTHMG
jgi:hypothetical protein